MAKLPKPAFWYRLWFIDERKKYYIKLKVFKTSDDLNAYYNASVPKEYIPKHGARAACIWPTYKNKKRFLGEMIFSVDDIYPNIISHESSHMGIRYFKVTKNTATFWNRKTEEHLVTVTDRICNLVHKVLQQHKVKMLMVMPKR